AEQRGRPVLGRWWAVGASRLRIGPDPSLDVPIHRAPSRRHGFAHSDPGIGDTAPALWIASDQRLGQSDREGQSEAYSPIVATIEASSEAPRAETHTSKAERAPASCLSGPYLGRRLLGRCAG